MKEEHWWRHRASWLVQYQEQGKRSSSEAFNEIVEELTQSLMPLVAETQRWTGCMPTVPLLHTAWCTWLVEEIPGCPTAPVLCSMNCTIVWQPPVKITTFNWQQQQSRPPGEAGRRTERTREKWIVVGRQNSEESSTGKISLKAVKTVPVSSSTKEVFSKLTLKHESISSCPLRA